MHGKRGLSKRFLDSLKKGNLESLLKFVKADHTLDLQIRDNYINIYYRGGNILKVKETNQGYSFGFDKKYLSPDQNHYLQQIDSHKETKNWFSYFSLCKQIMDLWFGVHKKEEREFQQLVARDNNYSSLASSTDFFIIDMEYDNRQNARFDLIALEWPSESGIRKLQKGFKPKLWVIEMKYGDGAVSGESGIIEHYNCLISYFTKPQAIANFKEEMLNVFSQKRELGLIPCLSDSLNNNRVHELVDDISIGILLANHDPASTKLKTELCTLIGSDIKILTANYFGYGLYNNKAALIDDFLKEL